MNLEIFDCCLKTIPRNETTPRTVIFYLSRYILLLDIFWKIIRDTKKCFIETLLFNHIDEILEK